MDLRKHSTVAFYVTEAIRTVCFFPHLSWDAERSYMGNTGTVDIRLQRLQRLECQCGSKNTSSTKRKVLAFGGTRKEKGHSWIKEQGKADFVASFSTHYVFSLQRLAVYSLCVPFPRFPALYVNRVRRLEARRHRNWITFFWILVPVLKTPAYLGET